MSVRSENGCAPAEDGESEPTTSADESAAASLCDAEEPPPVEEPRRRQRLLRVAVYVLFAAVVVALTGAAGYLKYTNSVTAETDRVREQSVRLASEVTVDMLSYTPENAESKLNAAGDRLTGSFRDSYLTLVRDVVIPGAKQRGISATATVPASSSVSASTDRATVMVFVNQTVTMGNDGPTDTASVVEVDLEKSGDRWLVSGFEPR